MLVCGMATTEDTTPEAATTLTEAECPECLAWSRIAPTGPYLAPVDYGEDGEPIFAAVNGPWWWTNEAGDANEGPAGCPECDAVCFPESECNHRERAA